MRSPIITINLNEFIVQLVYSQITHTMGYTSSLRGLGTSWTANERSDTVLISGVAILYKQSRISNQLLSQSWSDCSKSVIMHVHIVHELQLPCYSCYCSNLPPIAPDVLHLVLQ